MVRYHATADGPVPFTAEQEASRDAEESSWIASNSPGSDHIKAEAARRILAILPEWEQRNLTARAVELVKKGETNWTQAEAAEWAAGEALWSQIKAVRAASDALEAMSPIPANYANDVHWTA